MPPVVPEVNSSKNGSAPTGALCWSDGDEGATSSANEWAPGTSAPTLITALKRGNSDCNSTPVAAGAKSPSSVRQINILLLAAARSFAMSARRCGKYNVETTAPT